MNMRNKDIAEFMGLEKHHQDSSVLIKKTPQGNEIIPLDSLNYDSCYNALMEVVEKIRKVPSFDRDKFSTFVEIHNNKVEIYSGKYSGRTHDKIYFSKVHIGHGIETLYKAVLDFIHWYNKR